MEKIRVVQLVPGLEIGGAEKHVVGLVRHYDRERIEPHVCCLTERGALAEEIEAMGAPLEVLAARGDRELVLFPRLVRYLRRVRPHVVHTHLWTPHLYGRVAGRTAGVPVVVCTEHSLSPWKSHRQIWMDRVTCRWADMIVCVSEAVRQERIERERLPMEKLRTIYNFHEGKSYREPRDGTEARREFGIPDDSPVVGIVARLDPVKALDILFAALAEARKVLPRIRLLVIGDGPMRKELERLADTLGLADSVIFTGFRGDVPRLLWAIDVGVLCSHREGLSTALLEYMSARKPVVATNVGGNPEVVVGGVTGLLVPEGEVQRLAAALTEVLTHPQRARAMGEAGKARVDALFSAEPIVRQIEALYAELLARKGIVMEAGKAAWSLAERPRTPAVP